MEHQRETQTRWVISTPMYGHQCETQRKWCILQPCKDLTQLTKEMGEEENSAIHTLSITNQLKNTQKMNNSYEKH